MIHTPPNNIVLARKWAYHRAPKIYIGSQVTKTIGLGLQSKLCKHMPRKKKMGGRACARSEDPHRRERKFPDFSQLNQNLWLSALGFPFQYSFFGAISSLVQLQISPCRD